MKNNQKACPAKFQRSRGFVVPLIIAIVAILVLVYGYAAYTFKFTTTEIPEKVEVPEIPQIVGGDKDEHGCIGSAGYSWCAVKNKCLRVWEEKCEVVATTTNPVACTMDAMMCPDGTYVGRSGPDCKFVCPATSNQQSITIISPNGGEIISYSDIYQAGDLMFRWKTSSGVEYKPSSSFKAYIIDSKGLVVRDDKINTLSDIGSGIFVSSFIGESKINNNTNYKIKVCDLVNNILVCDTSDDYFIVK
jgi:hypothetical protein